MRILVIESSPRGSDSTSIGLTRDFLSACRSVQASIEVDRLNVWDENLPEFDQGAIGAKYKALRHADMTPGEAAVWQRIQSLIERFRRAERIVVGCPMWNFSIPYKLKQLIDLVAQRRYLFSYDGKSYGPELRIGKGLTVYTRGSHYAEGTPIPPSRFEHQARYLDFWLDLVGVTTLRTVVVDNAWNLDDAESARSIADGRAKVLDNVAWFLASP